MLHNPQLQSTNECHEPVVPIEGGLMVLFPVRRPWEGGGVTNEIVSFQWLSQNEIHKIYKTGLYY